VEMLTTSHESFSLIKVVNASRGLGDRV